MLTRIITARITCRKSDSPVLFFSNIPRPAQRRVGKAADKKIAGVLGEKSEKERKKIFAVTDRKKK